MFNKTTIRKLSAITLFIAFATFANSSHLLGQTNKYQEAGFKLLDDLNTKYYNSSTGLYVESINTSTMAKSAPAFLWPAAHMIRALLWGSMIDSKYNARLQAYVNKMPWYTNGEAYGCIQNGERFFDDNGLIGDVIMDVYKHKFRTTSVLAKSTFALNYCMKYRDAQWGLPQTESGLNKGIFYMGPLEPLANAYTKLYVINGDTSYLHVAKTYYNKFNDYTIKLKDPTSLLFVSGTTYANGVWTKPNEGPRACNTAAVVLLGIRLYQITGDQKYLTESRAMADAILKRFYKYNQGFGEISFWGGNYSVEMLCEMYEIDRDPKWYNAAKNICDFLIDKSRDKGGYYPDGTEGPGYWNVVRTNNTPATSVGMMSQACAANAILRFAYTDLHKPLSKGTYKISNVASTKAMSTKTDENGTKTITTSDFTDSNSQKWTIDIDNEGFCTLKSFDDKLNLALKNCTFDMGNLLETNATSTGDCIKFKIENTGGSGYKISHKSGKVLSANSSNQPDEPILLAESTDTDQQKWTVERLEPTISWITLTKDTAISTNSGAKLSVNVSSSVDKISKVEYYINGVLTSTTSASPYLYNWLPKTSGISEVYAIAYDKAGNSGYSSTIKVSVQCINSGSYKIANTGNNKFLSINSTKASENEAEATTASYVSQNYQHWNVQFENDGFYSISAANTNYKLGLALCATENNTQLKQYATNTGDCQKFYMIDLGSGQYQICAKNTTKAIAASLSTTNDTPVYLWDRATSINQKWKFSSIETGELPIEMNNLVEIYPNPVINTLYVRFPYQNIDIEILNTTGQKLISTQSQSLDVSSLASGIYILHLTHNEVTYKTKFIKR